MAWEEKIRRVSRPTARKLLLLPALAGGLVAPAFRMLAQQSPAPIERRAPAASSTIGVTGVVGERRGPRGEHLAQWMNQHSSLSPTEQQRALENEPGFHDLPQQTQQRMVQRLAQLGALPPAERQRRLAHIEAMEKLSPAQRTQVRSAMSSLGALPQDQRREVARVFRSLRDLPPEQRVQAFASGQYGPPLNDTQRGVLMNLLQVEPMLPPPPARSQQNQYTGQPQTPPMSRALH